MISFLRMNNNWLSYVVSRLSLSPVKIFLTWLIVSLARNLLIAYLFGVLSPTTTNVGLFGNLIWILHDCLIHPAILAYYSWMQTFGKKIIEVLTRENVIQLDNKTKKILGKYSGRFQSKKATRVMFLLSLLIVIVWYISSLLMPQENSTLYWITANPWIGIIVSPTLFVVAYALVFSIYDVIMLILCLRDLFKNSKIRVNVLNPDQAGGLSIIGQFSGNLSYILALLGLTYSVSAISLKAQFLGDYPNLIALIAYVVLAPFVFFTPLWSAHKKMVEYRDQTIREISVEFEETLLQIKDSFDTSQDEIESHIKNLKQLYELRELILKFPVWPFKTISLVKFFGVVYSTVLPGFISIAIEAFLK